MSEYQRISAEEAHTHFDEQSSTFVDVRDEPSYQTSHITHAGHIDNHSLASFINDADKTRAVIVCCYHGHMSQTAAQMLAEQGFKNVFSLDGGFELWRSLYPECCSGSNN